HTDFIPFVANTKNKNTQKMLQITNNQYKLSNDATFQNNNAYHYTCLIPEVAKTSTTTGIYTTSSTSPMDYTSTRKNLLATFQQNQTKPFTISNIATTVPLTTQPEIKLSTLT
ncbi:2940_t:CDS:2, partial [Scutellospora calospora]